MSVSGVCKLPLTGRASRVGLSPLRGARRFGRYRGHRTCPVSGASL